MTDAAGRTRPSAGRRTAGGLLLAIGVVLVAFAGTRYAEGAVRAAAVRDQWEAAQVRRAVDEARRGVFTVVAGAGFERGAPVARLRVPRLGLDEIVVEGVGDGELNVGPGHVPGSALPGEPGNAVISAHRDRHFSELGALAVGDTVVTELGHATTRWVVVSRRVLDAGEPALFSAREPTLTLTTCWPIRYVGPAPERLIVTARPIRASADEAA